MADLISRAIEIAAGIHRGQVDKGNEPYIFHVLTVMEWVREEAKQIRNAPPGFIEAATVVAVLHDVIEDYEGSPGEKAMFRMMLEQEFGSVIYNALMALTKFKGESYEDYIERVAQNPISRFIKPRDLRHNMDPRRLPAREIFAQDYDRWDKYRKALVRLERED